MSTTTKTFAPGDRVIALPDTEWDDDVAEDDPDRDIVLLAGHYGHVVAHCDSDACQPGLWGESTIHVCWEGSTRVAGNTIWTSGAPWHMSGDEIDHID